VASVSLWWLCPPTLKRDIIIDLYFLILSDPTAGRFGTDVDPAGAPTMFGTVRRNLQAEEGAMVAGLAPGQIRSILGQDPKGFKQ